MTHADKRTPHTDALDTLGMIIDNTQKRDAIHLGVEPIVAGCKLRPGEHVGIKDGKALRMTPRLESSLKLVGIVDPFLESVVLEGEMFWLVVYPRKITSIRHVWTHPDFPVGELDNEPSAREVISAREASEKWMCAWAMEHMSDDYYGDYDTKLDEDTAYSMAIRAGENTHIGPYEDAREYINDEWWGHWETITGKKGDRDAYFSCSC